MYMPMLLHVCVFVCVKISIYLAFDLKSQVMLTIKCSNTSSSNFFAFCLELAKVKYA